MALCDGNGVYGNDKVYLRNSCRVSVRIDDEGDCYIELGKYPSIFDVVCSEEIALTIAEAIQQASFDKARPGPNGETAEQLQVSEST